MYWNRSAVLAEDVVSASRGAFEAMVHRALWKRFTYSAFTSATSAHSSTYCNSLVASSFQFITDPLCSRLLSAGIAAGTIKHWMKNPIITNCNNDDINRTGGKLRIFQILRGLDATQTVRVCSNMYHESQQKLENIKEKICPTSSRIHP